MSIEERLGLVLLAILWFGFFGFVFGPWIADLTHAGLRGLSTVAAVAGAIVHRERHRRRKPAPTLTVEIDIDAQPALDELARLDRAISRAGPIKAIGRVDRSVR